MSGTIMDTNPLPARAADSTLPDAAPLETISSAPVTTKSLRRETALSPLLETLVGSSGVYPGARWLIYLCFSYGLFRLLNDLIHDLRPHGGVVWWGLVSEAGLMMAVIIPAIAMARIENRPFGAFGLPKQNAFRRNFWVGTVWGIVSLSVLMIALRIAGAYDFGGLSIHGWQIAKYAVYYAIFFLMVGFFEEFLLRGYSQWVLTQGMNFWPTAALLSAGFGALHGSNPGESKAGLVAAGLIGFFFCLTLRRTGDLWWAVGFHMSWDWGESYFYSVPDSGGMSPGHLLNSSFHGPAWLTGGSVGPEGSLFVFAVIVALWVVFDRVYPEVKYQA
jgi:membrane protease YdiL (CAAX protease family)